MDPAVVDKVPVNDQISWDGLRRRKAANHLVIGEDDPEEEVGEGSGCSDDVGELGVMAIDNPSCGDEVEGDDSLEVESLIPLDSNDGDCV